MDSDLQRYGWSDGRHFCSLVLEDQPTGIKPHSAFAGALRLADDVTVEFDLAVPQ